MFLNHSTAFIFSLLFHISDLKLCTFLSNRKITGITQITQITQPLTVSKKVLRLYSLKIPI